MKARFYIDGEKVFEESRPAMYQRAGSASVGALGKRRHVGDLDEVYVFDGVLSDRQVKELADGKAVAAPEPMKTGSWKPETLQEKYKGLELRTTDDALLELAEGSSGQAEWAPWGGPGDHSILMRSFGFNPKLRLLRDPVWEPGRGRLIYERSEEVQDTAWADQLGGGPFWTVDRGGGMFDLISSGGTLGFGVGSLGYFRNVGQPGEPRFEPPQPVTFDGFPFGALLPAIPGDAILNAVQDIDADGTPDLLICKLEAWEFPDGHNFWQHKVSRYSGKGRSYSVNGAYLADGRRAEFFWLRGGWNGEGMLSFSEPLPVYHGREDFPLIWKGPGHARGAVATIAGRRYIVLFGSLDRVLAVPFEVSGDVVRCGEAVPLLAGDAYVKQVFMPHQISVADLDGDGNDEVMLSGNPGSVSVLHGSEIGNYAEAVVYGRGGPVREQTLVVAQRVDWDGDGQEDLLLGDAAGTFNVWPGTDDPMVYAQPEPITLDGQRWVYLPDPNASIQGDDERRWAYVNPLATDWDGDGTLDIVFGELGPQLNVARGLGGYEVAAPEPIRTPDRKVWRVAWRQRPDIVSQEDGERKVLIQDWDGDFAVASFQNKTPMVVRGEEKLRYEDGEAMRMSGPGGFWGRGKPAVADWDADGDWDIVYGGHGGNNRYVDPALENLSDATTMWFENVGGNDSPRFARAKLLTLNGEPIQAGKHVASVWPTDLDGDGTLDLIFGTDNGWVYAINRGDIVQKAP